MKKSRLLLLLTVLFVVALISSCGSTSEGYDREQVFKSVDQDDDGIALRSDFELAVALTEPSSVAATYPGGEVTVEAVLRSLEESPPSRLVDPSNPAPEFFMARLTSMLRLRLAAVAIQDAGFAIDFEVDDVALNSQVQAHVSGGFESWARVKAFEADSRLEKFSTPHCVTVIAAVTESEAALAKTRIDSGESAAVVASQVNMPGVTRTSNGDVGCANLLEWANTFNEAAAPLGEMVAGEVSEVVSMASDFSPSGRLWMVFVVRELKFEEMDPLALGPFAQQVLADLVVDYFVQVSPAIGQWDDVDLSVKSPR